MRRLSATLGGNAMRMSRSFSFAGARIIIDRERRLNPDSDSVPAIDTSINKEAEARRIIFDAATPAGLFCDFGAGGADLTYLLAIDGNFAPNEQEREDRARFAEKFSYVGIELEADPLRKIVAGDICSPSFAEDHPELLARCAVIYSNNVFEHLRKPWIAAKNVLDLLVPGGAGIIIVPFSQRYHEVPADYFRYSHTGLVSLFEDAGEMEIIRSGYDILGRRNDWQGLGKANDLVPLDAFGAWRETWFSFLAFRKSASAAGAGRNAVDGA
jgi:SAM-dependent methyltransferase